MERRRIFNEGNYQYRFGALRVSLCLCAVYFFVNLHNNIFFVLWETAPVLPEMCTSGVHNPVLSPASVLLLCTPLLQGCIRTPVFLLPRSL